MALGREFVKKIRSFEKRTMPIVIFAIAAVVSSILLIIFGFSFTVEHLGWLAMGFSGVALLVVGIVLLLWRAKAEKKINASAILKEEQNH